ncbi:hypothetical protein GQ42DRAFT_154784 [Ramicandelaber brevisporus]|nr:hypothetical protein GQ42DRAFT_154784 [Ramicandelaber brevisporus]
MKQRSWPILGDDVGDIAHPAVVYSQDGSAWFASLCGGGCSLWLFAVGSCCLGWFVALAWFQRVVVWVGRCGGLFGLVAILAVLVYPLRCTALPGAACLPPPGPACLGGLVWGSRLGRGLLALQAS